MYAERRGEVKDPDKGLRRTLYRCTKTERYYITRKGRTVKKKKKRGHLKKRCMMKIRRFYMATKEEEGVSKLRMDAERIGKKDRSRR